MTDPERIVLDPAVLTGKPVIRGTRLSVDFVIGLMADGWTEADILQNCPGISHNDLAACLVYARDVLRSEKVYPSAAFCTSSRIEYNQRKRFRQAAERTSILTFSPARVARVRSASRENLLIFPCSRSLRRGWVMPNLRAARACDRRRPCLRNKVSWANRP